MNIKSGISGISFFLGCITVYLVVLFILLVVYGYHESFLLLNGSAFPWLDKPMFIITHMGDSMILASVLTLMFIWKKPEAAFNVILIVIITGILGQLLKGLFFEGWDRPLRVFNESPIVHTLPHYRLFHNSFPSGHSITVMAAITALVGSIKPSVIWQIIAAAFAIIISYSRVYLGVHFPGDVLAGSLIGAFLSILLLPLSNRLANRIAFNKRLKVILALSAFIMITSGAWFLRVYFPLI